MTKQEYAIMDTGRKPEIQRAYEYFESLCFWRWYLCHRSAAGLFSTKAEGQGTWFCVCPRFPWLFFPLY